MNPKILDNFSKNEILSILENECKFFELILSEVKPNYVISHEPYQHHDELFFELSKSKKIPTLVFFFSTLGYRCEISQNVHYADNISNMKKWCDQAPREEVREFT